MAVPPAFQFYASDWLASVSSMTLEERGAYITLLAWSWEHGPVPNEMKRIAAILGTHIGHARRVSVEVLKRWNLREDNGWINARLEQVRVQQSAFSQIQTEKARRGVEVRMSRKRADTVAPAQAQVQPEGQPGVSTPISDLRSPDLDPLRKDHSEGLRAREEVLGPVAWRKPGNHDMHAFCGRVCVPWGLHTDFLSRHGGVDAGPRLMAWYPTVLARYEGQRIGDDLFAFWRNEFTAWAGTVTTAAKPSGSRTGDSVEAGKAYLREKLGKFAAEEEG